MLDFLNWAFTNKRLIKIIFSSKYFFKGIEKKILNYFSQFFILNINKSLHTLTKSFLFRKKYIASRLFLKLPWKWAKNVWNLGIK